EHKARGVITEIIVFELAEYAASCLPDLIQAFRENPSGDVRMFVLMALEIALLPESVEFFGEVLRDGEPQHQPYALRALKGIDTRDPGPCSGKRCVRGRARRRSDCETASGPADQADRGRIPVSRGK